MGSISKPPVLPLAQPMSRRVFLARAAALGASATTLGSVLAACATPVPPSGSPQAVASATPGTTATTATARPVITPSPSFRGTLPVVDPTPVSATYGDMLEASALAMAGVSSAALQALVAEVAADAAIALALACSSTGVHARRSGLARRWRSGDSNPLAGVVSKGRPAVCARAAARPERREIAMTTEYLDFQAIVGITKHTGGAAATRELLALCHVDQAREVLEVGSGIGVGAANLARDHGCHVVAIDRSQQMIEWARRRAWEHGVTDRVELLVASATELPFEDGRFDIAYAESVLAFVDDPARAIREMARVTRPGGHVGLNESIWTKARTPELEALARDLNVDVRPAETWRSMCEEAGLEDIVVRLRRIDPAAEVRNRLRWVGLPWAVRAWGRTLRLVVTNPESRAALRTFYGPGMSAFGCLGYGLFVGKVPESR